MPLGIDLTIAARNLIQHRRRTLFLALALAAVTALLILMQALSSGARENLLRAATTLTTGHLNVGGFFKPSAGKSAAVVLDPGKLIETVKHVVPETRFVVQRGRGWAKLISDSGSMQLGVSGIDVANEPALKQVLQIRSGRLEDLAQPNTVLVFESQLKKLGVEIGDTITIFTQTAGGAANTVDCRVVAIARDVGMLSQWSVFVPAGTLRELYRLRPNATGAIHLYVDERHLPGISALGARLRAGLEAAGYRVMDPDPRSFWLKFETVNREAWTGQSLDVTTWEDELSFMTWTVGTLDGLTALLMVILLAIVVTGLTNTMWISIRERTREIGALRAIGMQRGAVLRQFLLESLLLGAFSTALGVGLGTLAAAALNAAHIPLPAAIQMFLMSNHLHLAVRTSSAVGAIVGITAVAAAAALYPAFRAARLRPVAAMSHFG